MPSNSESSPACGVRGMHGSLPSLPPVPSPFLPSFLRSSRCRRRVTFNGTDGRTSNQKAITCQHRIASIGLLERGWREGGRPWPWRWRPCIPVSYPLPSLSLFRRRRPNCVVFIVLSSFLPSFLPSFRPSFLPSVLPSLVSSHSPKSLLVSKPTTLDSTCACAEAEGGRRRGRQRREEVKKSPSFPSVIFRAGRAVNERVGGEDN